MRLNRTRMNLLIFLTLLIGFSAVFFNRSHPELRVRNRQSIQRLQFADSSIPQSFSDRKEIIDLGTLPDTASGSAVFDAFDRWVSEFLAAPQENREAQINLGVRLAE